MDALTQLNSALVGRYEIQREIGAGGMATVYLARDVKHSRNVALKVLRPDLGAVLGVERFLSEIQVTANLQHPNLLPLFDSGEANGLLFYVMPFVEGESLRARLDREKQLPVDETIRLATSVASALDYAHRHNVIHRDLKPENVLLHEGQPLVADFGIALAVSNAGGGRITQTGLSLGTPHYMSPEQATGDRSIDARTDIYSLGAMVYEMLTGDPPHVGSTSQAVIARVLTERPRSIRATRASVPAQVEAAVDRALEKLPADRWATAKEFAEGLSGERVMPSIATAARTAEAAVGAPGVSSRRQFVVWLNRAVVLGAALVLVRGALQRGSTSETLRGGTIRFPVVFDSIKPLFVGGAAIALSHDGSKLALLAAHGGRQAVYVRRFDDGEMTVVRGTEGGTSPVFSPDGESLAFVTSGSVYRVPVTGGSPTRLGVATASVSWDSPGVVLAGVDGTIVRIPIGGSDSTTRIAPDTARGIARVAFPHGLPDGRSAVVSYRTTTSVASDWLLGVMDLESGRVTELGIAGSDGRYVEPGYLVYARSDGAVMCVAFSARRQRVDGPHVVLADQASLRISGLMDVSVTAAGMMVYRSGSAAAAHMVRVSRNGVVSSLSEETRQFAVPRVSPNGRQIATSIASPAGRDIWTFDVNSRTLSRLTTSGNAWDPKWTADGSRIAYSAQTLRAIVWQPWDGSGVVDTIIKHDVALYEVEFPRAGKWMAYREDRPGQVRNILVAPVDSPRAVRPFLATPANERSMRISPDGALIAYTSDESGRDEIYMRPFPGPGGRVVVSANSATEAVWSRDGRELFYRTSTHMMSATIARDGELRVVRRDTLFADGFDRNPWHQAYDVFSDRSFVMVQAAGAQTPIMAVVNWQEIMRRASDRK